MKNSKKNFMTNDPAYELWEILTRTRYRIFRAREKELRPCGISPVHAGFLFTIKSLDNHATPAQISRILLRAPQTTTATLKRMVRMGLVRKTRDLKRRNIIRIALTEKGQKALECSLRREVFQRAWSVLTPEKRELLASLLKEVLEHVQNTWAVKD